MSNFLKMVTENVGACLIGAGLGSGIPFVGSAGGCFTVLVAKNFSDCGNNDRSKMQKGEQEAAIDAYYAACAASTKVIDQITKEKEYAQPDQFSVDVYYGPGQTIQEKYNYIRSLPPNRCAVFISLYYSSPFLESCTGIIQTDQNGKKLEGKLKCQGGW